MNRFPHQINYDLGSLDNQPAQEDTFLIDNQFENDVYEFTTSTTSNINISLNNISEGDDADLRLYSDSNNNGVLDSSDLQIDSSLNFNNNDDVINHQTAAGTYFARVNYHDGGNDGRIDYEIDLAAEAVDRFLHQINYDLGSLDNQPAQEDTFLTDNQFENDVYEFSTNTTSNINISLNNISEGDDADLRLYSDSNNNGLLDSSDLEINSSLNLNNNDDSINHQAAAGTYFARVNYHDGGDDGRIDYEIDLASDFTGQVEVGSSTIATDRDFGTSLIGEAAAVETGSISNSNTSDTYSLSVINGETIDVTLDGLSNDADLRVIQDYNQNNIVDADEVYASSTAGGTSSETISFSEAGDYFVEVFQFSGSTDYTLQFDQEFV